MRVQRYIKGVVRLESSRYMWVLTPSHLAVLTLNSLLCVFNNSKKTYKIWFQNGKKINNSQYINDRFPGQLLVPGMILLVTRLQV